MSGIFRQANVFNQRSNVENQARQIPFPVDSYAGNPGIGPNYAYEDHKHEGINSIIFGSDTQRLALVTSSLYVPTYFYDNNNNQREWLWDGTGWVIQSENPLSFATVVTSSVGTITTLGTLGFVYARSNGWLDYYLNIEITTNGTGAGVIFATLPYSIQSGQIFVGSGREYASTGNMLQCFSNTSSLQIAFYNNAYPGASGYKLACSGRFRMASRYS